MLLNKLKTMAQVIGYAGFIFLAVQGILSILAGEAVWAAPSYPLTPVVERLSLPQFQINNTTVPTATNYQGTLQDGDGNPLDGSYNMTFRIYNDVIDPIEIAIYSKTLDGVTVRNGRFSVTLEDLPPDIFKSPNRFVGITIDPYEEMTPRQRFVSVAYAFNSHLLDGKDSTAYAPAGLHYLSRDGGSPSPSAAALYVDDEGDIGIGTTDPTHKFHVKAHDAVGIFESTGHQAFLRFMTVEGFDNRVEIANRPGGRLSLWTAGARDVFNITRAGNVGIGTIDPTHKFHVRANGAVGIFESTSNQAYLRFMTTEGPGNRVEIANRSGGRLSLWTGGAGDVFNITRAGNVGIGTINPQAKLDVYGEFRIRGKKPMFIQKFQCHGTGCSKDTGISDAKYFCEMIGSGGGNVKSGHLTIVNGNYIIGFSRENPRDPVYGAYASLYCRSREMISTEPTISY